MIAKFLDREEHSYSSLEIQPNGEGVIVYLFEDDLHNPSWVHLSMDDIQELESFLRQVRQDYE